ncbi:DUF1289 domain-containing protein [methane-oxidizing endosymbiont of Gigantopelta aegis]|uniref:DUF1289 domain-containing protein n=1 Tax=methane-oxidizing endosymbiont of Gigantopelta aegis TaxID=2794938 RepID=UPI0018DD9AD0|nr:DUF1289 domain-containing protein [methane-oxidizing endosymbiont of Gigantopelta aegis]
MKFVPCNSECTHEGTHCEGCGRSHEEIAEMKKLVMDCVEFARHQSYENIDDYVDALARSVRKKLLES